MAMGEMSSLLLEGQNVRPSRLLDAGFQWKHSDLLDALTLHLLTARPFHNILDTKKAPRKGPFPWFQSVPYCTMIFFNSRLRPSLTVNM